MTFDASQTIPCEWRSRFEALVRERLSMPFAWGTHDCCMWAADIVQAITGTDPAEDIRGTYGDALGAARVLDEIGGLEVAGARAGESIPPLTARVGDIGLIARSDRELLAVCAGAVWLGPAAAGLAASPLVDARLAWRVARG